MNKKQIKKMGKKSIGKFYGAADILSKKGKFAEGRVGVSSLKEIDKCIDDMAFDSSKKSNVTGEEVLKTTGKRISRKEIRDALNKNGERELGRKKELTAKTTKDEGDPRFCGTLYLNWHLLQGKTIVSVNTEFGDNVVCLKCSDGSEFVIDVEPIGMGMNTPILLHRKHYVIGSV